MRYLSLGADRAGSDKVLNILPHLQPPELALDECPCSVGTWVAGELGGVTPLDDLSSDIVRNEQSAFRAFAGCCLGP